jgi:hypothetical protein
MSKGYNCSVVILPWRTNTEYKIYTSSHNVIKYYIHIGPTAKQLCVFFSNFCQVFFMYMVLNKVKEGHV